MKNAACIHPVLLTAVLLLSGMTTAGEMPQQRNLHLLPVPARLTLNTDRLVIDGGFRVAMTGSKDDFLIRAANRFLHQLGKQIGIQLAPLSSANSSPAIFNIRCNSEGEEIPSIKTDESYALEVTGSNALLTASSRTGVIRGLQTFLQLIDLDERSFYVPAVAVEDRPRFRWRGLLIDVCRHWQPIEVIKRNLDAMEAAKLNVFHWHLADDQGFRIESKLFPKLHQKGSEGNYYTQSQAREIVAYARDRGIRVIPEFDMPGHSTSWFAGYPELASAPGPYQLEKSWGVFDPCMDPTREKTYSFLNAFIGEMAGIFPDEYFHIGGDEVNGRQWNASAKIRTFMKRHRMNNSRDLQAYFNQRLLKILNRHGKNMIGWDEVLHPDLPKTIAIQSWRGQAYLADSARRGYEGILSNSYYLDHMKPASFHYLVDPLGKEAVNMTEEEKARVLGGEACMWGEFVNADNIDSRIWPRAAAIAERLWSPPEVNNVQDMYDRLEYFSRQLDLMGLMHNSNKLLMLERISGGRSVDRLEELADLLQPLSLGARQRAQQYTRFTPLNRLADTVLPESDVARQFAELIDSALADPGSTAGFQVIRNMLIRWRESCSIIKTEEEHSFLLEEAGTLAGIIYDLSNIGLQALDFLESRRAPPESWRKEQAESLDRLEKPQAELQPAIANSIRKLVDSANAIP
jgi:hexosaminidase